jgi:hypothetical protein
VHESVSLLYLYKTNKKFDYTGVYATGYPFTYTCTKTVRKQIRKGTDDRQERGSGKRGTRKGIKMHTNTHTRTTIHCERHEMYQHDDHWKLAPIWRRASIQVS